MLPSSVQRALGLAVASLATVVQCSAHPGILSARQTTPTVCNNSPDLCQRAYNNITHMGAHDAPFLRDAKTGRPVAGNQFFDAIAALDGGLRLLQAQVHVRETDGQLRLCHTTCDILDAGPLADWLGTIGQWLGSHPSDVVTLILVNSDNADASRFGQAFESAGVARYGFRPTSSKATGFWPTLAQMISADTRLVSFVTNTVATEAYPYIIPQFEYVFETPFEVTSAASFGCELDRPKPVGSAAAAVAANYLPLLNHFLYQSLGGSVLVPDVSEIDTTNSPSTTTTGALGLHATTCRNTWGVKPVFVLVDFWDKGPAIDTADLLNGVSAATGRAATPVNGGGSSGGASGGNRNGAASSRRPMHGVVPLMAFLFAAVALV